MIIRELNKEDITEVSKLIANRHSEERTNFGALNKIYEDEKVMEKIMMKKLKEKLCVSVAAFKDKTLLGYIISDVRSDKVFGRCAWVKYDGLALANGVSPEIYRELYASIAEKWLELGCLKHFIIIPAGRKDVIDSWLSSGFAYEQVFGIKKIIKSEINHNEDVEIIKASENEKDDLESISGLILSYQAKSPTYAAALPEMFEEIKQGYGGLVSDDDAHVLLAYRKDNNRELLGFTCGYFDGDDDSNMMVPYKGTELGVAGTNPKFQSNGIGRLLTNRLLNDSLDAGYLHSITDWRITNLKSSVFWPKMGYEAYAYRFVRNIDPRAYWANGVRQI